jgi:hypothetical protein
MADTWATVVTDRDQRDLCAIARSWPLCSFNGSEYVIITHCQLPNGSLVKLHVRRSGADWIVSDGGAAVDEAAASGIDKPMFGLNVRRAIRSKGLHFIDGRIESPKVGENSLFNAVVVVANACRDIAETLIYVGGAQLGESLERRARKILIGRFHAWVLAKPVLINGASDRQHKFDTAINLPDGRKILIDAVRHQGNSINSSIVANIDVRRLNNPNIVQRIVFDPEENWKNEDIELLGVGATPVALPSLVDSVERIAA